MKAFRWAVLLCAATLNLGASAQETDTLAKAREKGQIVMGVRESSPPLSYSLGDRFIGYHIELCERVLREILPSATIRYMPVSSQNRIALMQNGTIDLECGSTSNTASRQQQVSFANTTYITEVRFAVKASSGITTEAQLAGKTVNTLVGSAHVARLRKLDKDLGLHLQTVLSKDHAESFLELESGRVDALAMDDNILAGNLASSKTPDAYRIIGKPLSKDPIAIMLRKDDPAFKKAVDDSIKALVRSGDLAKLYDKWFLKPIPPRNTVIGLPMSESLKIALLTPNDDPAEAYETKP